MIEVRVIEPSDEGQLQTCEELRGVIHLISVAARTLQDKDPSVIAAGMKEITDEIGAIAEKRPRAMFALVLLGFLAGMAAELAQYEQPKSNSTLETLRSITPLKQ